ncbi:hypothetical protein C8Q79DRAFT_493196 [Trametes meyenii]|nr:hypothetical protein C8Q79DRAFT_493196 [Trametes meyenii]
MPLRRRRRLINFNASILFYISQHLSRHDLSALSKTCHALHGTLVYTLLRESVCLSNANIQSFYEFMHLTSDHTSPFSPYLLNLTLGVPDSNAPLILPATHMQWSEVTQTFLRLLRCASRLVSLSLGLIPWIFSPEHLRLALALVPRLEHLTLSNFTTEYGEALAAATCPRLRTVHFRKLSSRTWGNVGFQNPLPFLRNVRLTITSLGLFANGSGLDDHTAPFPVMRQLDTTSLHRVDDNTCWVAPLIHLFPNLEHLHVTELATSSEVLTFDGSFPLTDANIEDIRGWRAKAREWQARHGTWSSGLKYLNVRTMLNLYQLGLVCEVARLDIRQWAPHIPTELIGIALSDIRVRKLRLDVHIEDAFNTASPVSLGPVFNTRTLTHLIIAVRRKLLVSITMDTLLFRLGALLRHSSVTHILLGDFSQKPPTYPPSLETGQCKRQPRRAPTFPIPELTATYTRKSDLIGALACDPSALLGFFLYFQPYGLRAWMRDKTTDAIGPSWEELDQQWAYEVAFAEGMLHLDDTHQP